MMEFLVLANKSVDISGRPSMYVRAGAPGPFGELVAPTQDQCLLTRGDTTCYYLEHASNLLF